YAMDRDQRWERVRLAWDAMVDARAEHVAPDAMAALDAAYARGENDEFVRPTVIAGAEPMRDGDAIVFMNFRADRARQLAAAFVAPAFDGFAARRPALADFTCLTEYDATLPVALAFAPDDLRNTLGEVLGANGLAQLRIAETEKYAHVTFFFNGGREAPFTGEDRVLVPSPKDVATYDLKPEMSAFEVADEAKKRLEAAKHSFMLMNFANADMVGHTGNYEACVRAIEALDRCLETVVGAAERAGYHTIITADHGNAEEMCDHRGHIHTQHTLNPVPAIWVAPNTSVAPKEARFPLKDGS